MMSSVLECLRILMWMLVGLSVGRDLEVFILLFFKVCVGLVMVVGCYYLRGNL